MSRSLFILLIPLLSIALHAHPGHDFMQHGASHVATSLYHLAPLAFLSLVCFTIAAFARRPRLQRILRGTGVLSLVAVAVLWTLRH